MNIDETELGTLAAKPNSRSRAKRRKFTHQFKMDVVRRATAVGASKSSVARRSNISSSLLANWVRQWGATAEQANGADEPAKPDPNELDLLRTQNQLLRAKSDILTGLVGYFASMGSHARDGSLGRVPEDSHDLIEFFRSNAS